MASVTAEVVQLEANARLKYCQVCGKPGAAIRYRKYACNACRVFFSRAIVESTNPTCPRNDNCLVHYLNTKKNCNACRLKKCHEAGMEATDVGKKSYADRAVLRFTDSEWSSSINNYARNHVNRGIRSVMSIQMSYGTTDKYIEMLRAAEMWFLSGPFPSIVVVNPLLNFTGSCTARYISLLDYLSQSAFEARGHYKVMESTCRIMIASSELMCLVTEFKEMVDEDKDKLLQYNGRDLAILLPFLTMFGKIGAEISTLHSDSCALLDFHTSENSGEASHSVILRMLKSIKEALEELHVSAKEMHVLLLISLFQPSRDQTPDGYQLTLSARSRLSFLLGCLIRDMNCGITNAEILVRLPKFLNIVKRVKEISAYLFAIHDHKRTQKDETSASTS